jgi:hypothetical protein
MKVRIIALALLVFGLAGGLTAATQPTSQPVATGPVHVEPYSGGPGGCCV